MQIDKKGVILVAITLFLVAFAKDVFAATSSFSPFTSFTSLYTDSLYGWLDFFIYFLIFTSVARLTLEKKFGKESPAVKPLYVAVGLALSISLTLWTTANGISFLNLGPAALFLLVIALIALGYQWFQGKGEKGKEHQALGLGFFLMIILLLIAFLYTYPEIFGNFVPGISSRDLLFLLTLLAGLLGLIWLLSKILGFGSGADGAGGKTPGWLRWLLAILALLLVLYFLSPYFVKLLGFGAGLIIGILGLLLLLFLLYKLFSWLKNRKPGSTGGGSGGGSGGVTPPPTPKKKIKKVQIIILPDRRGKPYPQGSGDTIKLSPLVEGGSGTFGYSWSVEGYRLPKANDQEQTLDIDSFRVKKDVGSFKIVLWVTDTADGATASTSETIKIGKAPSLTSTIRITSPWKSRTTQDINQGDNLKLVADLSDFRAVNTVEWGFVSGAVSRDLQSHISSATAIGRISPSSNTTSTIKYSFNEAPGVYTILAWATDASGALLDVDAIIVTVKTPAPITIEITSPKMNESMKENEEFKLKVKVTSGKASDIASYEWVIVDSTRTPVPGTPITGETAKFRIATVGDYGIVCAATDKAGTRVASAPIIIHVIPSGGSSGPVSINIDAPTSPVAQNTNTTFKASTNPPAASGQYIYQWIFRKRP